MENDAPSPASGSDPGSHEDSLGETGSYAGNSGSSGSGGLESTNGEVTGADQGLNPDESDGSSNGVIDTGSGNSGYSSDDSGFISSSGNSPDAGYQEGSGSIPVSGTGQHRGENSPPVDPGEKGVISDPDTTQNGITQFRGEEGSGSPQAQRSSLTSGQGRDSPPGNQQDILFEEHGVISGQKGLQGSFGMLAASAGSAGMIRSGWLADPFSSGQTPYVPSAHRQQGMPEQPGHHPCGPAQTTPVIPVKESKETEIKDYPNARPRSKRARTFTIEEQADQPPASPPSSSRIPLFPFSFLLFGGYRRISRKNVLEQDTRNLIYHAVTSNPGIDVPALVRTTGINENTLRYHLVKLIDSGRIAYLIKPGVIRYFLNQGSFSLPEQLLIHYLWSETPRNILFLLDNSPGITRQQISDALGISGPSVTRQMEHLIEDRIIENRWPGRSNHYYLTEEAMRIFKRLISGAIDYGGSRQPMPLRDVGVIPEPPRVY
jgi:DNA-binding MarR family transcriptional regulator